LRYYSSSNQMILKSAAFFLLVIAIPTWAQFPDEIVLGPSLTTVYSRDFSMIRLNGQMHIPGDFIDVETDVLSLSLFPDKKLTEQFGISWFSLLALPPFFLGKTPNYFNRRPF
jgi:hypothetical protein